MRQCLPGRARPVRGRVNCKTLFCQADRPGHDLGTTETPAAVALVGIQQASRLARYYRRSITGVLCIADCPPPTVHAADAAFRRRGCLQGTIEKAARWPDKAPGTRVRAKTAAFAVSRALPLRLGLVYPYDWGFIPGTKGEEGDPIDALAVHDGAIYPGVILPCRPLGVGDLVQEDAKGPIENPRLILMPIWHDRMGELEKPADLPTRVKAEIEQFFLTRLSLRTSRRR